MSANFSEQKGEQNHYLYSKFIDSFIQKTKHEMWKNICA